MSIDATRWAWQQRCGRSADKVVLLSLADRADERHRCYPSISRLADDTELDRKTVLLALGRLESAGLLRPDKREGRATIYHLLGVEDRRPTSTKNGTGSRPIVDEIHPVSEQETSPENGTGTKNGTGPKNGTTPVPKTGLPPVPKTGHEPTIEPTKNLNTDSCADAQESIAPISRVKSTKVPPCPHREIIDLYHEVLPELPGVVFSLWDGTRKQNLADRWKASPKHQTLVFWRWYFGEVRKSKFHLGDNARGWRANLAWLVNKSNFVKILEPAVSAQRRRAVA